jgi:uncharacterized membrane protein YkvA (DUF1232 family)
MNLFLTLGIALAATYVLLLGALLAVRPKGNLLNEALRLLPDLLRLLRRLAGDRSVPRAVRARLWLLLGYLAFPIDLVPDFIPVLGYADDAIIVSLVLRSVVRRAGPQVIRRHWQGTRDGLAALSRLAGIELQSKRQSREGGHRMIVMFSARRLKPGAWDQFRRAWDSGDGRPPGLQRVYHARNIRDEDEIISFGLFDMTADEYHRWRSEAESQENQRVLNLSAFIEAEPVSGVYNVIEELEE